MLTDALLQGPEVYIPYILLSLVLTLAAYGAFPLIFARGRKTVITRKKYNLLCYGINLLVMFVFFSLVNGGPGGFAPFFLWTWVFSASGLKTLKKRGLLEEAPPFGAAETPASPETPSIRYCRNCGAELMDGASFCNKCGTAVTK